MAPLAISSPPNQSVPPPLPDLPNSCEPGADMEVDSCKGGRSGRNPSATGGDRCESANQCGGSGGKSEGTKGTKKTSPSTTSKSPPKTEPKTEPISQDDSDSDDGDYIPPKKSDSKPADQTKPPPPQQQDPDPTKKRDPDPDPVYPPQPVYPVRPPPPGNRPPPPLQINQPIYGGLRGAKLPPFILRGWFDPYAVNGYTQAPNTQKLAAGAGITFIPNFFSMRLPLSERFSLRINAGVSVDWLHTFVYGPGEPVPMKPQDFQRVNLFAGGLHFSGGFTIGRRSKTVILVSVDPLFVMGSDPVPTHFAFKPCLKGGLETRSLVQLLVSFCYYSADRAPLLDPAFPFGFEIVTPR